MNPTLDRLYELLPAIHRIRDAEQGEPLRALLRVITEQADLLEADIAQLYENWFIETCDDWVVPYLGDLIGYRPVAEAGRPGDAATPQGRLLNRALTPRREIANTLRYRRRKGSLALLESLAADVAGWPARAVEFLPLLSRTQHLNYQRLAQGRSVDVRQGATLALLNGPFDAIAHGVDVRRIHSSHSPGRYNPAAVGLFVWRIQAYSVSKTSACCVEEVAPHCYTFSALGNDSPLYHRPQPDVADTIAEETGLPVPIRCRLFHTQTAAAPLDYGEGRSFAIWAPGWPKKDTPQPLPRDLLVSADLSDWRFVPAKGQLAIDTERGRLAFPSKQLPKKVWVSYYYGFSAPLGGGEYPRELRQADASQLIRVCGQDELQKALLPWQSGQAAGPQPARAVVEIADSGVYVLPINLELAPGRVLQIRAADASRPIIRLLDWQTDQPDSFSIRGGADSHLVLDGLLIAGRGMLVEGPLGSLVIRHCTLVPGWSLDCACEPCRPAEPSLTVLNSLVCIRIEHSIVGSIQIGNDEVNAEPLALHISDSIVDATGWDGDGPESEAIGAPGAGFAHASATIVRTTVFGCVNVHALVLAEDSIFMGTVCVARRQWGCMRFCYAPPTSRTPRRYHCQPDLATAELSGDAKLLEQRRVVPHFSSSRYGTPAYAQLAADCAVEIVRGAEDESEMGAFHDLFQPQRLANLRTRLQEYTPAGTDADIILAS
ncbi:hypothetical protein HC024_06015 [Methylococcaceae bacterium WWC4]|nr:hypothetical protein [Methylococcaceae bacterium WWC4]